MINFWDESIWLPSNTSWKDIENGPDKKVVYGTGQDFLVQVPLVLLIIALRYFCEQNFFRPLGKYLKISNRNRRKAPENDVLEAHYKMSTTLKDLSIIAKKVDMSEGQVQRWWRLRRSQDKPSTLVKFTENLWKGSFYLCKECYAVSILWSKDWTWDIDLCFDGYPHQGITSDVKWYYMISSAFYWSLIIFQFYDVRRKDFWQIFIHHILTITLMSFSWICNLHRIGSLILIIHDTSDIFLEFAKAAKYARKETVVNILFCMFLFVWTFMRLYVLPMIIITRMLIGIINMKHEFNFPMMIMLNVLLYFLMLLNLFWTWLILKLLFRMFFCGQVAEDVRSSCSENTVTEDESSEGNKTN